MKYPKKWRQAVGSALNDDSLDYVQDCLDRLHEAGALKDPPKPADWWIRVDPKTWKVMGGVPQKPGTGWEGVGEKVFHVREVEEE